MSGRHGASEILRILWLSFFAVGPLMAQDLPEPLTFQTSSTDSNSANSTLVPSAAPGAVAPAEAYDPVPPPPAGNVAPYTMTPVPRPKKKTPPAFPGPQTLPP